MQHKLDYKINQKDSVYRFFNDSNIFFQSIHLHTNIENYLLKKHVVDGFRFIYIVEGSAEVEYNGTLYQVKKNDFILHSQYSIIQWTKQENCTYISINFSIASEHLVYRIVEFLKQSNEYVLYHDDQQLLYPFIKELLYEYTNQEINAIPACTAYFDLLLTKYLRTYSSLAIKEINNKEGLIFTSALSMIHEQLFIDVHTLPIRLQVKESTLNRIFLSYVGLSITKYYMYYRIETAKKLLHSKQYSVQEIADLLGFNSIYHFSNTFKKHTGLSPKNYYL